MKNRNVEFFNLSFLDLLSGALAAIIFLFIIVPKGEITLKDDPVTVIYDTLQNKFYGSIPDGFNAKGSGDTLLAIIGNLEGVPVAMKEPVTPTQPEPVVIERPRTRQETPRESRPVREEPRKKVEETPRVAKTSVEPSNMKGSPPNVPCMLSFEIQWAYKKDNVDLFVCKDNACVFGGKRYRPFIGYWDSGKARTSIFGGDLRTNQEAVRQFDEIIPGTYDVFVQYKESTDPKSDIHIRFQAYTKNSENVERGDEYHFKLSMDPVNRTRIARITVKADGQIQIQKFK